MQIKKILKKIKPLINLQNAIVLLILIAALILRLLRINTLLGFWFDQGREALVIWDFIYKGKLFLIGPTTGIAGIFRGPWYYWLITPFYFLGKGDPVYPAVFQVTLTFVSLILLYRISRKLGNVWTSLITLTIASFSYSIIMSSRWFSAPPLMYILSVFYIWSIYQILEGKTLGYLFAGLIAGLSVDIGSAAAIFYIPSFFVIMLLYKRDKSFFKGIFCYLSSMAFIFLPHLIFNFRHNGILFKGIENFLIEKGSFKLSFGEVLLSRLSLYYDVFATKIWPETDLLLVIFLVLSFIVLVTKYKEFIGNKYFTVLLILLISPIVGMLFFQGNEGNIYDYYFTGYYFVFILLFSSTLGYLKKFLWGKAIILGFLFIFLFKNFIPLTDYLKSSYRRLDIITIAVQKEAIDWIYKDAGSKKFNVDVYVPPVIPYSYDYLFKWYGEGKFGYEPETKNIKLLYTLYEIDPPHPQRLESWLNRQKGIGKIVKEQSFGGITVQRRERL